MVIVKAQEPKADWRLITLVWGLTLFGLLMVANTSVVEAFQNFGDKLYYFKLQLQWAGLGFLAFLFFSFCDYHHLQSLAFPLIVFTLFSLVLVLVPGWGSQVFGARRWLTIGSFRFQPAELAKLALVIYLAAVLSGKKKVFPFLFLFFLLISLVVLEPDLGTAVIIMATSLAIYLVAGIRLLFLGVLGGLAFLGGIVLILTSPYRRERLLTFLNPMRDPLGASYHIRQILIALGSGGLFGLGLGQSRQKYEYLPAVATDSILAVIGEELGFVGICLLVSAFLFLVWRGLKIAQEAPDQFGRLLATGIVSWVGVQTVINLGAMGALFPLTGVPLPFISYGGSSLILVLSGMGILVNISKQKRIKKRAG